MFKGRSDGSPLLSIPIHSPSFRQVVSSSAPTSSLDMDTIVRCNQDSSNEPEFCRDRRKKDIHNMSWFYSTFFILFYI